MDATAKSASVETITAANAEAKLNELAPKAAKVLKTPNQSIIKSIIDGASTITAKEAGQAVLEGACWGLAIGLVARFVVSVLENK